MALDILHDNWGPYTHTEVENALKAYLTVLENRISQAIQSGGVGLADLSTEVRALLNKANTALQPENIAAWAKDQNKPGYTVGEITGVEGFQNLLAKLQDMDAKIQAAAASGVTVDPQLADSDNPVANRAVKAAIDALTNTLNTLIGSGNVQGAIDTFNEVVAFLNGINSSDTLAAKLAQIQQSIPSVDGFVTEGDIPTKVSDLTNDLGFITAAALTDVVVGNGDFAMTYDEDTDTFNIVLLVPTLQVTPLSSMSASTKSGTFKVSGTNLKGDVTIALPQGASNWLLSTGGGAGASSLTLSPTNGTLAETTITVTYSGSTDSVGNTITISSTGAESKTVTANYTVTAGPTIFADATKTVTAIAGSSATTTIEVTASQLTEGITVIKGGTNATKFNVTPASLGTSGGTLTVQFSPDASDTSNQSATITLRSSGADDVVITLTGQVLVPSLSITPSTITLESDNNVAATGTINVKGTNIVGNVALSISGTGFTISSNSLAAADVNSANGVDVTVTANIASGTTASATISATSGQATATASASWTKTEPAPAVGDIKTIDGIKYKITEAAGDGTHGSCRVITPDENDYTWGNSNYSGDVVIPDYITVAGRNYDVTKITRRSFAGAPITSIVLGQNITEIGDYAFANAKSITSISIPSGVSALTERVLFGCDSLTTITLNYNGVVSYGSASLDNKALTIYVPSGLAASYRSNSSWNNSNYTFVELQ